MRRSITRGEVGRSLGKVAACCCFRMWVRFEMIEGRRAESAMIAVVFWK
jgi:hypothetical protein